MGAHDLAVAALAMAALGFCFEICRTGTVALLQTSTDDSIRGRLMSAQFLLQQGAASVGLAVVGAAAEGWGVRLPVLCGTALALLVWIATARRRKRIAAAFVPADVSGIGDLIFSSSR